MTTPNQTKENWNKFNKLDINLKQQRDEQTGALTFTQDLNHTIEELGKRGFKYGTINKLAGQTIAETARRKGDRRYLDILDNITTPGGVYGHTVEGQKLKWGTVRQIENDAEQDERAERARYNHERTLLLDRHKITLGELIARKASLTDPNEIQEVEQEINDALMAAGVDGVGGQVQVYHDRLTKGLASTTQGKNRILGLYDVMNPEDADEQTVHDYLVEVLADPSTDSTPKSRQQRLATAFEGMNITLNDDAKALVKQMEQEYVAPTTTELYKDETKVLKYIEDNHLARFGLDRSPMGRALRRNEVPIPEGIHRITQRYKRKLRGAFIEEFGKYSNQLEGRSEDEGGARYGFGSWTEGEKEAFLGSDSYKKKVSNLISEYDAEMQKAVDKHLGSTQVKKDNTKDIQNMMMPAKNEGPKEYEDLQRMIYEDSDSALYSPVDTYERFKKAIFGLSMGATEEAKEIANLHFFSGDMQDWFDEAVGGSDDPKVKQKQLEALWNWGMYLIKGRQIKLIEIDPNLSTEQKEKRIKRYQKAKYPFPKDITSFIGAKKIIEEETKKKKKKPKTKKLSSLSKPESVKTEKKEEKPAFQDGVLDLKVVWKRLFGE
tara:strand:+ start:14535 stop:16352 length:1818 start_codon:yes stop_codon:yes gene_type:complete